MVRRTSCFHTRGRHRRGPVFCRWVHKRRSFAARAGKLLVRGWAILISSSDGSYSNLKTFVFDGFNLVEGTDFTYPAGVNSGSSLPMIGYRIKSAEAAAGGVGPGVSRQMTRPDATSSDSNDAAKASMQVGDQVDLARIDLIRKLKSALRAMQQQAN